MLFFNTNFRQLIEKEYIKPIIQEENPTIHTVGIIGQLCIATSTNTVFVCKQIDKEVEPIVYHWLALNSTAEDYNVFLDDIDELSETVEQNHATVIQYISDLYNLTQQDIFNLKGDVNNIEDNSIIKLDFTDKGATKELNLTYGDAETETIYLNHTHQEYLTQHQDISNLATKLELNSTLEDKANKNLSNVTGGYDWVTMSNNTSKYRQWRNKRLECENIATSVANMAGSEITLPLAYRDMDYTIQITVRQFGNYYIACEPLGVQKFKVRICDQWGNPQAIKFSWKTEGYIE